MKKRLPILPLAPPTANFLPPNGRRPPDMTRQIEPSQNLAPLTSTKATVQGLRKVHSNACALFECFGPKSKGERTTREFQRASRAMESALEHFATTINRLETATTKPDRNQALSKIKGALNQAEAAFEAIAPFSILRISPRLRPAAPLTTFAGGYAIGQMERHLAAFPKMIESIERSSS